ncbi:hypothetical protein E4T56_gene13385 [Termitomyces sp. T112]|nr:hypothetical protein C0989_000131 [Termitomyces sp. Mn162]KAG5719251.1 hypothetical protein E4T56_gene13385 [Termitomyces sp. T112]KAH0586427.1 hypothetical protein H2248_007662 [Termitomyces sp. 'cryptogamus']KNZ73076.1 hypothetical protein J132_01306 [Termitomyces sp. J132]
MSSVNRPRPRPRPKPRAPSENATPVAGSSSGSLMKPVQVQVDSDEMFMRNRNRTTNTWATLEKLTKEVKVTRDGDSDEEILTPKRKKARKRKDDTELWQNKKHINRILSEEVPSSDDDGVEIVGTSMTPRAPDASKQKRSRPRSRSRSITPPPELPRHQIQHMRALVEQTLNTAPIPLTRNREDDIEVNDEALFKNPELAKLAKSVKSCASSQAISLAPEGADTVQVAVKWKPHPLNPEGKEGLWIFKMSRDDSFQDLFEATAEEACIRIENLILTFEGKRIYASVTPTAFQMWGEVELVGCDKVTHEYLRTHPINLVPATVEEIPSDSDAPSSSHTQDEEEKAQDSEAEGETFKLILRSSLSTKDITLTVRPTTKCGAIVKAYLKKTGLADQYSGLFDEGGKKGGKGKKSGEETDPRLCIDGDKMGNDVEIGDADLEDGDMVEVVGL